jgi:F-BAR domain only protein
LENPIRNFATASDFGQLPNIESNLMSLADAQENTRQKAEKAKSKGKGKKVEERAREEHDARASWETESPLILEKMQSIDESRLVLLKDIFVKCMMLEVETSQSAMSETEGIMNSLLSLTPAKEVEAFVSSQKDGLNPTLHDRRRSTIMTNNQTFTPSSTASPVARPSPIQTRSTLSIPDDDGSVRSEKRKSRFGTILRSGRNSIRAPNLNLRGSSPEKKRKEAERERAEQERVQNLSPVMSQTSQNGVSEHTEPIAPIRTSSIANLEPQRSPVREERPRSRDHDLSQVTEEGERESIMSSESNYAPPLRVEIQKEVIPEEAGERDAAVNTLQSTLRAQSTISRKSRGRREGRNSMFGDGSNEFGVMSPPVREMGQMSIAPNLTGPMSMSPTAISPSSRTLSPIRYGESDTQSLASVRTASRPSGIALHPDLETPGFNISILESLSAILSDGKVQKIFVTGEIAFSNHGQRTNGLHLPNAANLEQIVVNKALLQDVGNGTYSITAEQLPPKGVIALKYKVALTEDPQTIVPLIIRTMWKIESGSVSLMVGYQLNSKFSRSSSVSNVVISTTLPTDPRIMGCQSKPQGQFSKERGQLIWSVPAPSLEGGEQILLAKFTVDGVCKGNGIVEAKWECRGVTVSGIDVKGVAARDPFADEQDTYFQPNLLKGLISGKYYCQS